MVRFVGFNGLFNMTDCCRNVTGGSATILARGSRVSVLEFMGGCVKAIEMMPFFGN